MENDDQQISQLYRLYMEVVKEQLYIDKKETTFPIFVALLKKFGQEEFDSDKKERLISKVDVLLDGHDDLINKFRWLVHTFDQVPLYKNNDRPVQQSAKKAVLQSSLEYLKKVKRTLEDEDKFNRFLRILNGFRHHRNIDLVEKQVSSMFKLHTQLEIGLSEFLAEVIEKRSHRKMTFEKLQRQVEKRPVLIRKINKYEQILIDCEDDMCETDVVYDSMLSLKKEVKRLIAMLGGSTNNGSIDIRSYFSVLNITHLEVLGYGEPLSNGPMTVGKSLRILSEIYYDLGKTIKSYQRDHREKMIETEWAPLICINEEKARQAARMMEWEDPDDDSS